MAKAKREGPAREHISGMTTEEIAAVLESMAPGERRTVGAVDVVRDSGPGKDYFVYARSGPPPTGLTTGRAKAVAKWLNNHEPEQAPAQRELF